MNTKKYILFALTALLTASCYDSTWKQPSIEAGQEACGNQNIKASNVKTIAQVKEMYDKAITSGDPVQVKEPMQIQGVVIGNDNGGNVYNAIYIQDKTGAICISIKQNGLYGIFPVGQSVMVELNGLYLGNYGGQPQIGIYSVNYKSGYVQLYGMSRYQWMTHYKIIDPLLDIDTTPLEITDASELNYVDDVNKLITLKGAILAEANGKKAFANPEDAASNQTAVNRSIKGQTKIILRTSTFADFAMVVMPTEKVDITGLASYYNGTWQILMRTMNDIKTAE